MRTSPGLVDSKGGVWDAVSGDSETAKAALPHPIKSRVPFWKRVVGKKIKHKTYCFDGLQKGLSHGQESGDERERQKDTER